MLLNMGEMLRIIKAKNKDRDLAYSRLPPYLTILTPDRWPTILTSMIGVRMVGQRLGVRSSL